jgi:hypothetical protein
MGIHGDRWINDYVSEIKELVNRFGNYEEVNEQHRSVIGSIREILHHY